MSDVRLTALNPETSSPVPVAANSKGELLIETPVIESIPNNVSISGDLTVSGSINGTPGGGAYLPTPFGPEGSWLAIVDGAPEWVGGGDGGGDGPGPIPNDASVQSQPFTGSETGTQFRDESGTVVDPSPNWDAAARELSQWELTDTAASPMGVSAVKSKVVTATFDLKNCLGKVFELRVGCLFQLNSPGNVYPTIECSDSNMNLIRTFPSENLPAYADQKEFYNYQWLCNRDSHSNVVITFTMDAASWMSSFDSHTTFQSWALVDSGRVALERQMAIEKQLLKLAE